MTDTTPTPQAVTPEAVASQVPEGVARSLALLRLQAVADLVAQLRSQEPADRTTTANILEELNQERAALAADLAAQKARADAAEARVAEVTSDRAYIIGANAGWEAAVEQGEATPAAAAILARAEAAEAKVARLVEALKPFAQYMADGGDRNAKGEPLPDAEGVGWVYLTIGDFRRASAIIALIPKGGA